jgi:hypothetical protein
MMPVPTEADRLLRMHDEIQSYLENAIPHGRKKDEASFYLRQILGEALAADMTRQRLDDLEIDNRALRALVRERDADVQKAQTGIENMAAFLHGAESMMTDLKIMMAHARLYQRYHLEPWFRMSGVTIHEGQATLVLIVSPTYANGVHDPAEFEGFPLIVKSDAPA